MENINFGNNNAINDNNNNSGVIELQTDMDLVKKLSFIGTMQKVFGVLAIIGGAVSCLGIITAIIGIPYILAGVKLFKSGSQFSFASYSNDGNALKEAIINLAAFWKFTLICIILTVVLYIALVIFLVALGAGSHYYY